MKPRCASGTCCRGTGCRGLLLPHDRLGYLAYSSLSEIDGANMDLGLLLIQVTLAAAILCGCSPHPTIDSSGSTHDPEYKKHGRPLEELKVPRTVSEPVNERNRSYPSQDSWVPDRFIGVALSGGGSRAAAFSAAVLQELDRLGILDHVTAISSVSGGSVTSAYFGLYGSTTTTDEDWENVHAKLRRDYAGNHVLLAARSILFNQSRTEIIMRRFDDSLYAGATFSSLGEPGSRRPLILINAARVGSLTPFLFAVDQYDRTQSMSGARIPLSWRKPLADVPISAAVMASAAVPGLLDTVTVEGRNGSDKRYLQLYDGGVQDNLGVEELINVAQNYATAAAFTRKPIQGCIFIVVDAGRQFGAEEDKNLGGWAADLNTSMFSRVVSPSAWDAIDSLIVQKSEVTLQRIGIPMLPKERRRNAGNDIPRVRLIHPSGHAWSEWVRSSSGSFTLFDTSAARTYLESIAPNAHSGIECQTWHISPANLVATDNPGVSGKQLSELRRQIGRDAPEVRALEASRSIDLEGASLYRSNLRDFFDEIETDFKLTGPAYCDARFIQDRIRDAAAILVREDRTALSRICATLENTMGSKGAARCIVSKDPPLDRPDLEWTMVVDRSSSSDDAQHTTLGWEIRCRAPSGSEAAYR